MKVQNAASSGFMKEHIEMLKKAGQNPPKTMADKGLETQNRAGRARGTQKTSASDRAAAERRRIEHLQDAPKSPRLEDKGRHVDIRV